jgi:hypothetical protein
MGATRKVGTTDEKYNDGHNRYVKNRDHILAQAKERYKGEREIRLKTAKKIRDTIKQERLREKQRDFYEAQNKPIPMMPNDKSKEFVRTCKKGKPCIDCGNQFPFYVMDYDHVRGKKILDVSAMVAKGRSCRKIAAEIEKCDLICANCHRERTFQRS